MYVISSFVPTLGHSVWDYSRYALSLSPSLLCFSKPPAPDLPNPLLHWQPLVLYQDQSSFCGLAPRGSKWTAAVPFQQLHRCMPTGVPEREAAAPQQVSHRALVSIKNTGGRIIAEKWDASVYLKLMRMWIMCWLCTVWRIEKVARERSF